MEGSNLIEGKKILIVDDEPDVLETLEDLLSMCVVVKAFTFEEAEKLLISQYFDMVVLDIMGVNGYKLLEIANENKMIAIMLTAKALSPDDIKRSYREGAASYIPKEEMINITTFLNDILEAKEKGKSFWWRWNERLVSYFDKKFGPDWQKRHGIKVR